MVRKMGIRKSILLSVAVVILVALAGCGNKIDYSLPDNPIAFVSGEYVNPDDPDDGYMSIEYKDRVYIPYGVLDGKLGGTDVGECLGYIVQDGKVVENSRVFTLSEDPDYNFLVDLNAEGFMDVPMFYRALDTKGQDIDIPGYIYDQGYEVWK